MVEPGAVTWKQASSCTWCDSGTQARGGGVSDTVLGRKAPPDLEEVRDSPGVLGTSGAGDRISVCNTQDIKQNSHLFITVPNSGIWI